MIVLAKGLEMCQDKIQSIQEWPVPSTVKKVQSFLGFANFYCRFISDYSRIVAPLTTLIGKNKQSEWTPQTDMAFKKL